MYSAVVRKSLTDLTRRRARALFTVLTLALAVASVGVLAVPALMERAMDREVAANRVPDVTVSMAPLLLDEEHLARLASLPNVEAVEPRTVFATRVFVGERRDSAVLVGVDDFSRQRADVVTVDSGSSPSRGVLSDRNNGQANSFDAGIGEEARVLAADGSVRNLPVEGVARNLTGADAVSGGFVTLYASAATVADLRGAEGYTSMAIRLDDNSPAAAEAAVVAVRDELRATTAFSAFEDLPQIREPGGYPGKDEFEGLASVLVVVTLLALLSSLVLLSNTMSTLVGEQTGEIAAMKAIGARRRDIRRLYLRTALILGALGGVLGAALGVVLSNLLVGFFATLFFGIDAGFGVSVPILLASLLLGLLGPPLAALPAVRRAARLPLGRALQASGAPLDDPGRLGELLRHVSVLPRGMQIGLRNLARRKRRSLATMTQVGLAVGILLALLAVGAGADQATRGWFDDNRFDVWVQAAANSPLPPGTTEQLESVEGVARADRFLRNDVSVEGAYAQAWGLPADPLMDTLVSDGRWYTDDELRSGAAVAVLAPGVSSATGAEVGQSLDVDTANGPLTVTVIGLSENMASRSADVGHNGTVVFLPLSTLQSALGLPDAVNGYWVATTSDERAVVDATTTRIEDALAARGSQVESLVNYDLQDKQAAQGESITTAVAVLGLLIVAISMVALTNAITMATLDRTREIGMLRSIGARSRDVRRIFAVEGLVVAFAGWLVGVPLGYALAAAVGSAVGDALGADLPFVFPPIYILLALLGTAVLAFLVMQPPLRRAVRLRPGDALRHA
jgi:putative ABC transport system permease protein